MASLCLLIGGICRGDNAKASLTVQEQWRNVFAGEKLVLHVQGATGQASDGHLNYAVSVGTGVILRGEKVLQQEESGNSAVITIDVPEIKDGIRMPLRVDLSLRSDMQSKPVAESSLDFTVFSRDPFYFDGKKVKNYRLGLYDPAGETTEVFQKTSIPFTPLKTLDDCLKHQGMLVIGEGLGGRDQKNVCHTVLQMAASGKNVLVLMPEEASIPLDFESEKRPPHLSLDTSRIIHKLDKKLDAQVWSGGRSSTGASCRLVAIRNQIFAEFAEGHSGWSWLGMDFPGGGKMLVVGFPIVEAWRESPTPRFLLSRLFEHLKQKERTQ